ncbi:hypothetical protein MPSI1_002295 [Malassezia psittaci]|uniref:Anaphase-promoting complex subunit 4-like WD40 domain-containing protein n=1 Tax=Malassezia psittaci TaxID=1821823 RepID=A0AAF0JE41_9BASI|nr:hypothetical protein MPSI1_002295 [Malassezia psittaci]
MDGRVTVLGTGVPVYALSFAGSKHLFYVGGGGAGKSGVTNNIKCAEAQTRNGADLCAAGDLKLRTDEDAPMCISVHPNDSLLACGINEAAAKMKEQNHHLRTFHYEVKARPAARADGAAENSVEIHPSDSYASLGIDDVDHYQKAIAFSPDGALLAVASSDGRVQLHRYPDMEPIWTQPYELEGKQEVYDLDFSHDGTQLVCTAGRRLYILSTAPRTSGDSNLITFSARLLQSIDTVTIGSEIGIFRAAKFGRGKPDVGTRDRLYALINVAPSKQSKVRSSYLAMWNADTWSLKVSRKVANRPGTVMSIRGAARGVNAQAMYVI